MTPRRITRRDLLVGGGALGAAAGIGLAGPARAATRMAQASNRVAEAAAITPAGSDLGAVEHVVFLMQENRSYDHHQRRPRRHVERRLAHHGPA
jgi:phospholipase C